MTALIAWWENHAADMKIQEAELRQLMIVVVLAVLVFNVNANVVAQGHISPSEAASGQQPSLRPDREDRVRLYGELVEGGAECQRFRAVDNSYYTLEGDLSGFRTGDTVEITGFIPRASHCMQDTPVRVETIRRAKPPGSHIK